MILHGMTDVAGQGSYAVAGLRKNGKKAELVVWEKNPFGYSYDKCLNISRKKALYPISFLKMLIFSVKAFFKYDVFHFHFGHTLLPFCMDLPLLAKTKKVFMEYHGSDIRYKFYSKMPQYWPSEKLPVQSERVNKKFRKIDKYVTGYLLHDSELEKHLPSGHKPVFYVPLKVDVRKFTPQYPSTDCKKPVIVHAPSNSVIKGSKYVMEALEKLKEKYDFEFILVQGKTQEEAFEVFKTADIIIDQLFIGCYGVFAIEAMAMGKPVICYISDEMAKEFPEELPIVNANIENIEQQIEKLIQNPEMRNELGKRGRVYAETYHDYEFVTKALADVYEGDYEPKTQPEAFKYVKALKEG